MYRLNHGGFEVVLWESGFRRAGERRALSGKDASAGGAALEKRRCNSSVLW